MLGPIFSWFCWIFHLSKVFDESTICVGFFNSADGYNSPSPRLWISWFLRRTASVYRWSFRPRRVIHKFSTLGPKMERLNKNLTENTFLSTFATTLRCYAEKLWQTRVCSRCKLWNHRFVKKQRYKVVVNLWLFMWRDLQFKRVGWYCNCWKTLWIEYKLHSAPLVSSRQTWARRWAPEHALFLSSNLSVIGCKSESVRLVHSWVSDKS